MDRASLESAAVEYSHLRGLLGVPLSLVFVLAAAGNTRWGPFGNTIVFLAALVSIGAGWLLVSRFYDRHYGRVTLSRRQQTRAVVATAAVVPIVFVGSLLARSEAGWSLDLPVNPIPAAFAVAMLIFHAVTVGLRTHHVVVLGALLGAGLLPVWDGGDPGNAGLVMCGAAVLLTGVLDHRLLVRGLGPARGLDLGDTGAGA